MTKYDELWNDINMLLSHVKSLNVIRAMKEYWAKYNNTAPVLLLNDIIDKLQKRLDNA